MNATYETGDFITIKNHDVSHQYEIIYSSPDIIKLIDSFSGIASTRKSRELDELIVSGIAIIHQKDLRTRKLLENNVIDFASFPEESKQKARERYIFVSGILEQNLKSHSGTILKPIVEQIYNANSFTTLTKKPGVRTVQYWLKSFRDANCSIRALLPIHHAKGNRNVKLDEIKEPYIAAAIEYFKTPERPSISSAYDYLKTLINYDNKILSKSEKIKVPSLSAFIKRLEKFAKNEIFAARLGKDEARKRFKLNQLSQEIKFILQRVEVDHTQADLFIVDSKLSMILGRPYITVLLDYKSKSILGFYIGFEKPSYLSVARALKHSILPKTYLKELYPEVESEWDCYGIPKTLAVDRGKDFESVALIDACHDLNIRIERNPAKHPWYKGSVESFFKSINTKLFDDMKGKVFPDIVDTNLYNPQEHAVITMDLFLKLFHVWIVDVYQQDLVSKGTIIPRVSWQEDLKSVPRRVMNKDDLDIVLSETTDRKNSPAGIVFDHIWYDNDELLKYRSEVGFTKVTMKYNREDLGFIYVLDERNPSYKHYFKVPAVDQKYAKGLSLHQHQVIKAFNKNKLQQEHNTENLAAAKMKIMQLISNFLDSASSKKISSSQKLSRFMNVGQQTDQTVKSSVTDISTQIPTVQEIHSDTEESNEVLEIYDGIHNSLPDKLNF
ncbi:hypothetical protein D5018_06765 [Parashewanella curva]|uniref:Integrase catalytic domain-containing protein n=1 Tax=Parashewanella curva TaxID=2338552 RepID=A0A3L8Q102_9GAMM|nr:Mu transposase C-terminal domain-containing protein [Parashewanella curva]RLV60488.1 hypothetical protein D5018_06765 [Parashewanella curva]